MKAEREYTVQEVAATISRGLSASDLDQWPRTTLPGYVDEARRAHKANHDGRTVEDGCPTVVPGFKMSWGVVTASLEYSAYVAPDTSVISLTGHLDADPLVKLGHLRRQSKVDEVYLSDLVGAALEDGLSGDLRQVLNKFRLEWVKPDKVGQLFWFIGISYPREPLPYKILGLLVAEWLQVAHVEALLRHVRYPTTLRRIARKPSLPMYCDLLLDEEAAGSTLAELRP